MLKVKTPKNIYLKGNEHAILLLHSFTGTPKDVKELAETLNEEGFTCYVPCYRGHGLPVSQFVEQDISNWWEDVEAAYAFLRAEGYKVIDAVGVSLGGIFSLKLAEQFEVRRVVGMSIPFRKSEAGVLERLSTYGERIQRYILCTPEEQKSEMAQISSYQEGAGHFEAFTHQTMDALSQITVPTLLLYGGKDDDFYRESAFEIEASLTHVTDKEVVCFENAGHLMTRSVDKEEIAERILAFICKS